MKPDMDTSPLIFDLESAPLPDARTYIDPPELEDIQAPKNYVKAEAIADYIEREKAKRAKDYEADITSKSALDWNVARIVALGRWVNGRRTVDIASNAFEEREMLRRFWEDAKLRLLVGFRIREFDLPMLMQRSLYLEVPYVRFDLGKYAKGTQVIDLYDYLTFNGIRNEGVMRQSLKSFARRLGIDVPDAIDGGDIPALVAAEQWDAIEAHCAADVDLAVAVAFRCGVVKKPDPTTAELVRTLQARQAEQVAI